MMKKVLLGVALALMACVSVGTLQSCKDDVSDLRTQTAYDLDALQQDLKNRSDYLQRQINANRDAIAANRTDINANRTDINKIYQLLGDYATHQYVLDRIAELKGYVDNKDQAIWTKLGEQNVALNGIKIRLNGVETTLGELGPKVATLMTQMADGLNRIGQLEANMTGVKEAIETLNTNFGRIDKWCNELHQSVTKLQATVGQNSTAIAALQGRMEAAEKKIELVDSITKLLQKDVADMQSDINNMQGDISGMKGDIANLKTEVEDLKNQVASNSHNITIMKQQIMALRSEFLSKFAELDGKISAVDGKVEDLKGEVESLTTRVDEIEKNLEKITNKVDNLVTAVLVQAVNSPVFGDFSLPIGVKSNLAFNWYGYHSQSGSIEFPSNDVNVNGTLDVNFAGAPVMTIDPGLYYDMKDGKKNYEVTLGTVYVTLNPLGNNFEGENVKIVNSLGEVLPVKVTALRKSNKKLTHGYTRAEIDSYLYEADIVLDPFNSPEGLEETRIKIEDNLETSMKEVVKDIMNRDLNKSDAVNLLKALYDQMSGMLTAYAVQYDWTVNATEENPKGNYYRVLSQYDLAAATARPLSYNFLEGKGTSKHLPIISDIDNIITNLKDKVKIEIEPLKVGDLKVDLKDVDVKVDTTKVNLVMVIPDIAVIKDETQIEGSYNLVLTSQKLPAGVDPQNITASEAGKTFLKGLLGDNYENKYKTQEYHYEYISGLSGLAKAIEDGVQQGLTQAGETISNNMREQINTNIIAKINKELKTQIDGVIEDLADDMQPFFNKANKAISIYNKIARKINRFLKDPNHYLQATALYSNGDDYSFASGDPKSPSYFKGNGDFNIYLTNYTAEVIVPAYKKYVAITGTVNNGKVTPVSVSSNAYGELNTILDGNQIRVTVPASKLKAGTYEFTYQALDYRGYTSTRKFYVTIEK